MRWIKWTILAVVVAAAVGAVLFIYGRASRPADLPDVGQAGQLKLADRARIQDLLADMRIGNSRQDDIPAIDSPQFVTAAAGQVWLLPEDVVFGLVDGNQAYAFPQRIMVHHEIVNLTYQGQAAALTYCPLAGTAIGYFNPGSPEGSSLGVSGRLVNSNLVMFDRPTGTYWAQLPGLAVQGRLVGQRLQDFPVVWTTWERWQAIHPDTKVLARPSDSGFDYGKRGDPYGSYLDGSGYYFSGQYVFPPTHLSDQLEPKTVVIGVRDGDWNAAAVVKERLRSDGQALLRLGGRSVAVSYDPDLDAATAVYSDTGQPVNAVQAMWFAWYAYYPDSQLIE